LRDGALEEEQMAHRLDGLRGVVTGAAGGLGSTFATAFVEEGASVEVWDVRAPDALAHDLGTSAFARGLDITDAAQVQTAMAAAAARLGRVDFFVNNAGVRTVVPFLEQTADDWRRTVDVNLTGTFLCAQAAARVMVEQGYGRILNISSIAGILAFTQRPAYVASKAGVMGLTRAIAAELGHAGVTCNSIAPGIIETAMTASYFSDDDLAGRILSGSPAGRWGQPDDLVGAAVFLCGTDSAFVNGATIAVDGGYTVTKGY
jgi:NAD(P)-dependent dehydrogenase (short-subunit alcohol dehydrogenase family)